LNEDFPLAFPVFIPIDKLVGKCKEITMGLGFDLIVDMGASFNELKRNIMKLCGPFCRVITTCKDAQIDPPESLIL
jgi:hypothetical protein